MSNPLCPVTGEPAVRLVQRIKASSLARLWRISFGVNAKPSFRGVDYFGLWESPTGLYFFDPMLEGDNEFYSQYYAYLLKHKLWAEDSVREEFKMAARNVKPGDKVLDVGCGFASFRGVVPQADYVGLDPNFAEGSGLDYVRNETLQQHLVANAGSYDAVCSFQVVEHVTDPSRMFADMVQAAKPGGRVIIGVPHVPSAMTRIPNFLLNAPPHHLTWWTKPALAALAERSGATVESIEQVPWGNFDSLMYWIERCSPIRCRDVHYSNHWTWHAAAAIGYVAGRAMYAIRKTPKTTDEGVGLILVARRRA